MSFEEAESWKIGTGKWKYGEPLRAFLILFLVVRRRGSEKDQF